MIFRILSVALFLLLIGCSDIDNAQYSNVPDKKYFIEDCVVKIDLLWEGGTSVDVKFKVFDDIRTILLTIYEKVKQQKFPLFSWHMTRSTDYMMLYYANACNERIDLTNEIIQNFFIPKVNNFPNYQINIDVIPGFDGVTPQGWWKIRAPSVYQ